MKTSRLQQSLAWAVTGLATLSTAQFAFSPKSDGLTYSVGIPSGSSISASSTGPLYFHIEAPTSYQWVALGIGSQMAGATIFVMYADGSGNVTLSGRKGTGQVEPQADDTLQAGLQLLAGSGIVNGKMIANVRCTSCTLQSDSTASNSPFIVAWNPGSPINSASTSATLRQHAVDGIQAKVDLSQASIASDSNPFIAGGATSGSSPTSPSSGNPTGSPTGNGNTNTGGVTFGSAKNGAMADYQKAHGIVMGVVVVLLFPFGAMFMRMGGSMIVHGVLQLLSLCAMLVGLGLGVKLKNMKSMKLSTTHTLFGIIIVSLFLLQPIFGLIHHLQYKRTLSRGIFSHIHIWYGRILMALAVINGGLGLKLAKNTKNGEIVYGVVAGVVGVVYIAMCIFKRKGGGKGLAGGWRKEEVGQELPEYSGTPTEGRQPLNGNGAVQK
ncbi:hypothetical protein BKA65DRAFT_459591 [Rhexocercosporidium sp. MPI-PUGE-AT-0058]|nr:hypothetical protein BKA65DRAFT_459591 [Rhexocercosporidium sp. MPI-PUGE-AT-0058]